jgi:hypothetical protein
MEQGKRIKALTNNKMIKVIADGGMHNFFSLLFIRLTSMSI